MEEELLEEEPKQRGKDTHWLPPSLKQVTPEELVWHEELELKH